MTNQEELERILEQVLMKHHDDISSQDDDAIAEAVDTILSAGYIRKDSIEFDEEKIRNIITNMAKIGADYYSPDDYELKNSKEISKAICDYLKGSNNG